MDKDSRPDEPAAAGRKQKTCWALYALQQLCPSKFSRVVGDIMRGRSDLTNCRDHSKPK